MQPRKQIYHSYLLRLWQVEGENRITWRASLENVETGALQGFSSLEELVKYLAQQAFAERVEEPAPNLPAA